MDINHIRDPLPMSELNARQILLEILEDWLMKKAATAPALDENDMSARRSIRTSGAGSKRRAYADAKTPKPSHIGMRDGHCSGNAPLGSRRFLRGIE